MSRLKDLLRTNPLTGPVVMTLWRAKRYARHRREGPAIVREAFERLHGRPLDVARPVTFTEKLAARMVRQHADPDPRFRRLTDKLAVRPFVEERIGREFLTRLHWVGRDPGRIPFDALPERYVVKPNHSSGHVFVPSPGFDRAAAVRRMRQWLRENYYWRAREYQYLHIRRRRILVEEFLDDGHPDGPLDYRIFCFDGTPAVIQVDNHHHDINPFYDTSWSPLDLRYRRNAKPAVIERPGRLDAMLEAAATLSASFDFVRVDLFVVGARIVVGEMTFTPVGTSLRIEPPEWDVRLGELWRMD